MTRHYSSFYLSHGGGPMPLLGDPGHQQMVDRLKAVAQTMATPSAIVLVSAHWEADRPSITSAASPSLIYDYYGFEERAYQIQYPAPGAPELALEIHQKLHQAGLSPQLDEQRGFDHGMFVPLSILFPEAPLPVVQLSLNSNLDVAQHIEMGRALKGLGDGKVLVIGSGFSFHNMRAFFAPDQGQANQANAAFERWLIETCTSPRLSEAQRRERLIRWEQAPGARFCHPREEHLLPLMLCYGVNESAASEHHELKILGKRASFYLW
ncbi:class III extradiol ring-cleavage dioxygenase [Ferrimonas sp. YFM]|uniref:DODA-type extradiol aromatic ring-opening family dioxygenase n=1 Tax=Ferrimonas sp. YFM TaxID=3028878 RepID=UPI002573583B|nr:class III extradiol ring-cleavage dioxygenase [Ferrimonas sp. YFM]BDY05763.1 dioxygenase [Ferrimonas sp. YFM]